MSTTNRPAAVIRDGALKVTIWRNTGENGVWFNCAPTRIYKDADGNFKETSQLSSAEPLQMAHLLSRAYDKMAELKAAEKGERESSKAA